MSTRSRSTVPASRTPELNPWLPLTAMLVGFFMILVDATIVAVANPTIAAELDASYDAVIWVTSAYLLAYAVPLLVAGRLGDRFGPKNLYLVGLVVFTLASLWCGLAGSIEMLIAARVLQGFGAALLTPQTMSTITRIFPAERRGVALSAWGATAGVATLVGPLAGGVLVDWLGWQWIFFVNVPVGVIGVVLGVWLIPVLPTNRSRFDVPGVLLSGVGLFLIVFALQEGQSHGWPWWIWALIVTGAATMAGFVYWQSVNPHDPLLPLSLFFDRNFSLSNVGVAVIGCVVTGMVLPVMFYAQAVCGLSPTASAALTAPMAVASGCLAPVAGRLIDRVHPTTVIGSGFAVIAVGLTWLTIEMTPTTPVWRLLLAFAVIGAGMAFIWSPLAATATRNLADDVAGAGSGVYNTTRQVGSVLGSAAMAAFMTSRLDAELPGTATPSETSAAELPAFLHEPFSAAMSQATLLPAFVALFGVVAALFLVGPTTTAGAAGGPARRFAEPDDDWPDLLEDDDYDGYIVIPGVHTVLEPVPEHETAREPEPVVEHVEHVEPAEPEPVAARPAGRDDDTAEIDAVTDPMPRVRPSLAEEVHLDGKRPQPEHDGDETMLQNEPLSSWLHDPLDTSRPAHGSIGFAHNGFHVDSHTDHDPIFREVSTAGPSRHARHSADDNGDTGSRGRHSSPD